MPKACIGVDSVGELARLRAHAAKGDPQRWPLVGKSAWSWGELRGATARPMWVRVSVFGLVVRFLLGLEQGKKKRLNASKTLAFCHAKNNIRLAPAPG